MIVLQAPLDIARGELPSDTRTLISHWEILRGKVGEIWRSEFTTMKALLFLIEYRAIMHKQYITH